MLISVFIRFWSSARGVHWVTAREGFMKISPFHGRKRAAIFTSVLFSKVLVGDKAIPDSAGLSLPYDRVMPPCPSTSGPRPFVEESRTRYSYLLEGSSEPAWSTPSIQSAINFVNLPPGKYTLCPGCRHNFLPVFTRRNPQHTHS